jgi:hypothetical protein
MSEEAFKNYVSQFRFENGHVYLGETRYMFMPVSWLGDMQLELENLMGPSGTFALFDTASRRTTPTGETLAQLKELPFEHKWGAFFMSASLGGFGVFQVISLSKDPFKIVFKSSSTSYGDAYEGKADSPRCYLNSTFIPYMKQIAALDGINEELKLTETQCVASGAPHCEFIIEPDDGLF